MAGTRSSWARDTHCRLCVFISCPVLSELRSVEHGDVLPPAVPSWRSGAEFKFAVALRQNVRLRANRSFDKQGHKLRMRARRLRHCESAADIPDYEFTSNGHVFSVFPICFYARTPRRTAAA